jgi:hypothetical protein
MIKTMADRKGRHYMIKTKADRKGRHYGDDWSLSSVNFIRNVLFE